ncbi:hypothetical protein ACX801_18135 [Arthrobacter bambusae]
MGLKRFFQRITRADGPGLPSPEPRTADSGPDVSGEMTPEQLADLTAAWGDLSEAAAVAGVTSVRACNRGGSSWESNPESVRAIATTLRNLKEKGTLI